MPDSGTVFPVIYRFLTSDIEAVNGGSIEFYNAGTTTPKTVYSDSTLSTSLGSIVYLNASGVPVASQGSSTEVSIYTGTDLIKIVVKDSAGATLHTRDNVKCAQVAGSGDGSSMLLPVDELASTSLVLTSADYGRLKEIDITGGNCTVALPLASSAPTGTLISIKRKGASNTLTIVAVGSDTVAGAGSLALSANGDAVLLASNEADEWKLVAFARPSLSTGAITSDLLDARIVGGLAAVGDIKMIGTGTVPDGWLECDGAAVSRTTYADLFAVIGETWGEGNNTTTFNLPDLRGRVPRGWDHGAARDPDRASRTASNTGGATGDNVGSVQGDAIQQHSHSVTVPSGSVSVTSGGSSPPPNAASSQTGTTGSTGTFSTETRMKNANVMFIILADPAAAAGAGSTLNTVLTTSGTPSSGLGVDGDFAIDSTAKVLYGPKAAGAWPAGVSLAGASYGATSTTSLAISNSGSKSATIQTGLGYSAGSRVRFTDSSNVANYMEGVVTAYTSGTGAIVFTADNSGGSGTIASWNVNVAGDKGSVGTAATIAVGSVTTGAAGSSAAVSNVGTSSAATFNFTIPRGDTGVPGATGAAAPLSLDMTWSTGTSGDPGSGATGIDNATYASMTAWRLSETDRLGSNKAALIASFDDSTSSNRARVDIVDVLDNTKWLSFYVTSAITDHGGYDSFTATYIGTGTALTNGNRVSVIVSPIGNKGADGAGAGDVVGPASSVDGEIALFNSTTGKLIKRASTTGVLKAASGVIAQAVAGTDIVVPGGALGTPSSGTLTNCTGLPAAGLVASTSQAVGFGTIELGHASDTTLARAAAGEVTIEGTLIKKAGKETICIPAAAWTIGSSGSPPRATVELAAGTDYQSVLDYDGGGTTEYAYATATFPKSWNNGTITFLVKGFSGSATSTVARFGLSAAAVSTGEAVAVTYGTPQYVTVTNGGSANRLLFSSESSAITIGGTPSTGDTIRLRCERTSGNVADTMGEDFRKTEVVIFFTSNASTDA